MISFCFQISHNENAICVFILYDAYCHGAPRALRHIFNKIAHLYLKNRILNCVYRLCLTQFIFEPPF